MVERLSHVVATPKKVTFKFSKDEHYREIPVNGAWGGPTPRGDVWVELFHESEKTPKSITHRITEAGGLGDEDTREPMADNKHYTRQLFVGMMLRPKHAESIGIWLQEKAREARNQEEGSQEVEDETTH